MASPSSATQHANLRQRIEGPSRFRLDNTGWCLQLASAHPPAFGAARMPALRQRKPESAKHLRLWVAPHPRKHSPALP
jgi:hypothetical protein